MKIKQFFINNKSKIKKVFSLFLIVLLFLFYSYTTFACGYNVKSALDDSIKKESVNRNDANRGSLGSTDLGTILIGETLSDVNDSQINYFVNFLNIELFEYRNTSTSKIEFELEFETQTKLYLYKNYSQYVETNKLNKTFSISFEIPLTDYYIGNKINEISIGTSDFEAEINDIYLDDLETFYVDLNYQIAFDIYVDTSEGDVLYENYYNYIIETNYPVSVYDQTASDYVHYLSGIIDESTTRYTPNKLRYFNLYDVGYDSGYQNGYDKGVSDEATHYEELIIPAIKIEYEEIGYDKGYLQGKNDTLNQGSGVALFDAFTLIGKGFEAWNPILNIQVLPGLTIGVFIAIPIVIAVVILVIKLLQR